MNPAEFNFDQPIDRHAVPGEKWGRYRERDVLPMWVADMDFAAPPVVLDALAARLAHGVLGYTEAWPSLLEAVIEGIARDHGWQIEADWLVWLPGVISGFNLACAMAGEPGDEVLVAPPVYPPMLHAPAHQQRQLRTTPLQPGPAGWEWDFAQLEATIGPRARMLLLCNPHNPVGRVFRREELQTLAQLAERHDLLICSDEIHCGLVLEEAMPHLPIAALDAQIAKRSITLMAPSKTWNVPGLNTAFAIIPDPTLRRRYRAAQRGLCGHPNVLGLVASEAAYRHGDPWRQALLAYLRGNRDRVIDTLAKLAPLITWRPEATYLAWIDCRALQLEDPVAFFEAAGVGLSDGTAFGAPGFVRLNFGCPRAVLDQGLARMARALEDRNGRACAK